MTSQETEVQEARPESPRQAVLTLNAGSSSIKAALFDRHGGSRPFLSCLAERLGSPEASVSFRDHRKALMDGPPLPVDAGRSHEAMLAWLLPALRDLGRVDVVAAGQRVVHGGPMHTAACLVDDGVVDALETLVPLARSHQPHELQAIRSALQLWPGLPQIACFDTSFHASVPEVARTIALPQHITRQGVRRYGFHGLSYDWISGRLPTVLGARASGRVVVAHLGNGASLCGLVDRESRATTMGFTTLDGLVMGDRPGLTDPGAILYLFDELGLSGQEMRHMLFEESGLRGVSGISNDMRVLMQSEEPAAKLAIDLFVYRAVREIGGIAAEIGGIDALVFTGGIGENAAPIRAAIMEGCAWLGVRFDADANAVHANFLSPAGARVTAHVIKTNEEAVIARQTRAVLAGAEPQ